MNSGHSFSLIHLFGGENSPLGHSFSTYHVQLEAAVQEKEGRFEEKL